MIKKLALSVLSAVSMMFIAVVSNAGPLVIESASILDQAYDGLQLTTKVEVHGLFSKGDVLFASCLTTTGNGVFPLLNAGGGTIVAGDQTTLLR